MKKHYLWFHYLDNSGADQEFVMRCKADEKIPVDKYPLEVVIKLLDIKSPNSLTAASISHDEFVDLRSKGVTRWILNNEVLLG